jgi:hypothetical protein
VSSVYYSLTAVLASIHSDDWTSYRRLLAVQAEDIYSSVEQGHSEPLIGLCQVAGFEYRDDQTIEWIFFISSPIFLNACGCPERHRDGLPVHVAGRRIFCSILSSLLIGVLFTYPSFHKNHIHEFLALVRVLRYFDRKSIMA